MCIKTHQREQMKFHIIGAKCGIHWNCPIVATQDHKLQLHKCLDPNCEWNMNPIYFIRILEIKNIFWVIEYPCLNKNGQVLV